MRKGEDLKNFAMFLGFEVYRARQRERLTQAELARRAGLTRNAIIRVEQFKATHMPTCRVLALCDFLQIDIYAIRDRANANLSASS